MLFMKPSLWILVSLLVGPISSLHAQTTDQTVPDGSESKAAQPDQNLSPIGTTGQTAEAGKDGFSLFLDVSHSIGAKSDTDPVTAIGLLAKFKQSEAITWSALQRLTKLYKVDPYEDSLQVADASLGFAYKLFDSKTGPALTGIVLGADATLPFSKFSSEQKLTTVLGSSITATRDFGSLSFLLKPFYRFHVNQFNTLANDDSGATMLRYRLGLRFDVSLSLPYELSLTSGNQWTERHYEDPPYGSHAPDHDYGFDLSLGYAFDKKTNFAISYGQSNRAEQLGTVDVYFYDIETSSYTLSVSREI